MARRAEAVAGPGLPRLAVVGEAAGVLRQALPRRAASVLPRPSEIGALGLNRPSRANRWGLGQAPHRRPYRGTSPAGRPDRRGGARRSWAQSMPAGGHLQQSPARAKADLDAPGGLDLSNQPPIGLGNADDACASSELAQ